MTCSVVTAAVAVFFYAAAPSIFSLLHPYHDYFDKPSYPVFEGTMDDTPMSRARAETLALLMGVYDALTRQAGVGDWRAVTDRPQATASEQICSRDPQDPRASERYILAEAGPMTSREEAMRAVEEVASPHGFTRVTGHEDYELRREADGAVISVSSQGFESPRTGPGDTEWPTQAPTDPTPSPPADWVSPAPAPRPSPTSSPSPTRRPR